MLSIPTTEDIRDELKRLYKEGAFREGNYGKTVEIQNAHFLADKDWIIREPNYDYAKREIEWYESQSLYVKDIPGDVPKIWQACADKDGKINSNYGWCIFSDENGSQYEHCLNRLLDDHHTREACMIYTRPSMQVDCNSNGMHDFMCTYSTQVFLNEVSDNKYKLDLRVVSMPSMELYNMQPQQYKDLLLPKGYRVFVLEAGSSFGWHQFVYDNSYLLTIDKFGVSAPKGDVEKKLGYDFVSLRTKILDKFMKK